MDAPPMTRGVFRWLLVLAAALLSFSTADARNRWVVFPESPETLPAVRYANLTATECVRELESRQVPFLTVPKPVPKRQTIDAPVVLQGEIRGVRFEFGRKPQQRDVLDCRLLLALDDLARIASTQGIATVRYNSIHRNGWARGRVQGHLGGVAIDITELVGRDGQVLNVKRDFAGERIGSATCGAAAKAPAPGKATQLRAFICALDEARVFNLLLSPHYDYRHRDHFHFEVRRGVRWFLTN
jgi:hypothetical protein